MPKRLEITRGIFDAFLNKERNYNGLAISDCRGKETMVITRYGGDVIIAIFNNETKEREFEFVVEMAYNSESLYRRILYGFAQIKAMLK